MDVALEIVRAGFERGNEVVDLLAGRDVFRRLEDRVCRTGCILEQTEVVRSAERRVLVIDRDGDLLIRLEEQLTDVPFDVFADKGNGSHGCGWNRGRRARRAAR